MLVFSPPWLLHPSSSLQMFTVLSMDPVAISGDVGEKQQAVTYLEEQSRQSVGVLRFIPIPCYDFLKKAVISNTSFNLLNNCRQPKATFMNNITLVIPYAILFGS